MPTLPTSNNFPGRRAIATPASAPAAQHDVNPRAAVASGLIEAGGNYMNEELKDTVARVAQEHAKAGGALITIDEAFSRIANDKTALAAALAEARELMPSEFIDVSRYDRYPESRRFQEKLRAAARVFSNRKTADRLSAKIIDGIKGRRKPA